MNLFIDLQPSKSLRWVLVMLWCLLTISFLLFSVSQFSPLTSILLMAFVVSVAVPCGLWLRKSIRQINLGIKQIQFIGGCWFLVQELDSTVQKYAIELTDNNVVWPWWIIFGYQPENNEESDSLAKRLFSHHRQKRHLFICRDSVTEADFRHLSRVLRYYRKTDEAADNNN